MDAVLQLHLHTEDLKSGRRATGSVVLNRQCEAFLATAKTVILLISAFVFHQLNLIATDIRLVGVPELVLDFNTEEHNQKPSANDRVIVEIDGFNDFVLFMLVLSYHPHLVLLLQRNLVVLPHDLHQDQLHVEVHNGQATQLGVVDLL